MKKKKENRKAIKFLLDVDEHIPASERTEVTMRVAHDLWNLQVKLGVSDKVPESMPDHPRRLSGPYRTVTEDGLVDQEIV